MGQLKEELAIDVTAVCLAPFRRVVTGARASSVSVFHSPQPAQRPCHFGSSWPQVEQVKTVVGRGMGGVGR